MQVGQIVKVDKNQQIPADLLVIKSSAVNNLCYFETLNLDGENALKPREAMTLTSNLIATESDLGKIKGFIEVDHPNKNIYSVGGYMQAEAENQSNQEKAYFNIDNVILRGGVLKNVDFVFGIVLYTGRDTKIMKNIK